MSQFLHDGDNADTKAIAIPRDFSVKSRAKNGRYGSISISQTQIVQISNFLFNIQVLVVSVQILTISGIH